MPGAHAVSGGGSRPDPELAERPRRRRFTGEYKLGILREAAGATRPGEIAVMLRREGLYSSHLAAWRKQQDAGALRGLEPRKRGPRGPSSEQLELLAVRARLERAEAELATARRGGSRGAQERDRPRRAAAQAMIEQAVSQVEPLVGTLPACRVLGASRASLYRWRSPPRVRAARPPAVSPRALSEPERTARCWRGCTRSGSLTARPRTCTPRCSTRGPISPRSARC